MLIKLIEDEEVGTWVRFEIHPKKICLKKDKSMLIG